MSWLNLKITLKSTVWSLTNRLWKNQSQQKTITSTYTTRLRQVAAANGSLERWLFFPYFPNYCVVVVVAVEVIVSSFSFLYIFFIVVKVFCRISVMFYASNLIKHKHLYYSQIGSRSSVYSPESRVRKTGSYIYEDFMPTDGTDVKVHCLLTHSYKYIQHACCALGVHCRPGLCPRGSEKITGAGRQGGERQRRKRNSIPCDIKQRREADL